MIYHHEEPLCNRKFAISKEDYICVEENHNLYWRRINLDKGMRLGKDLEWHELSENESDALIHAGYIKIRKMFFKLKSSSDKHLFFF